MIDYTYITCMNDQQKEIPATAASNEQTFEVAAFDAGERLDRFLAAQLDGVSRSRIQSVIRSGGVSLNGEPARTSETLRLGDRVLWREPAAVPCENAAPEDIPLDILFEDADIVVVNKPAGMVVHPGAGHAEGTLVSALLHHCGGLSQVGGVERPGIVHRLDKETSGCLIVAKNDMAHHSLAEQFAERVVQKVYLAVVEGCPRVKTGSIDAPIERHRVNRQKMAVARDDRGRSARTEYKVLATKDNLSLVECKPLTGRTHQIRVHLKHIGIPVAGDPVYGHRRQWDRHLLHAWKLSIQHPKDQRPMTFEAPPPIEFRFT